MGGCAALHPPYKCSVAEPPPQPSPASGGGNSPRAYFTLPRLRGREGWGNAPRGRMANARCCLRVQQRALLAFEHLLDRRALQQPVLQRGVVLQLLDRQSDALAPAVEHQRIAVRRRILRTEDVILAGDQAVDLLQQFPEIVLTGRLQVFM